MHAHSDSGGAADIVRDLDELFADLYVYGAEEESLHEMAAEGRDVDLHDEVEPVEAVEMEYNQCDYSSQGRGYWTKVDKESVDKESVEQPLITKMTAGQCLHLQEGELWKLYERAQNSGCTEKLRAAVKSWNAAMNAVAKEKLRKKSRKVKAVVMLEPAKWLLIVRLIEALAKNMVESVARIVSVPRLVFLCVISYL